MNDTETFYFFATNTSSRIAGIAFEPVDTFAGTMTGVYSTVNQDEAEALSKVPHVEKITKEDYDERLKKKALAFSDYRHSNNKSSSPAVPMKGTGAVVVENPASQPVGLVADDILAARPIETPAPIGRRNRASQPRT